MVPGVMTVPMDGPIADVTRSPQRNSLAKKARDAVHAGRQALAAPLRRSKHEERFSSDDELSGSSRRGSRANTRAKLERKRSSQHENQGLHTLTSLKRPRTADRAGESSMRSTAHLGRQDSNGSEQSVGLSPQLQPFKVEDRAIEESGLKLPPMETYSPPETASMASPPSSVNLPSVTQTFRRDPSFQRPRTLSNSSTFSTATGRSLPPAPYYATPNRSSSDIYSTDSTPTGMTRTPSSYFSNTSHHPRRTVPRSNPPALHQYSSSTTSVASVASISSVVSATSYASVPTLSTAESTTSRDFAASSLTTPGAAPPPSSLVDVETPAMPAHYTISNPSPSTSTNTSTTTQQQQQQPPLPGFTCTFPGCSALPFPTSYTLSSHTKKHTTLRPYFCLEDNCPRSEGGKDGKPGQGFKRKNEMVRHGLVHETPGYGCPWCPSSDAGGSGEGSGVDVGGGVGKRGKGGGGGGSGGKVYPRPDNLLRHIKDHHKDRDPGDRELREVLERRVGNSHSAEQSGRGRRRKRGDGGGGPG